MFARLFPRLAAGTLTLMLAGCWSGSYDAKLASRVAELEQRSREIDDFNVLSPIERYEGTSVELRMPNLDPFKNDPRKKMASGRYNELSEHLQDPGAIDPKRVQPPFVKLPNLKICWEWFKGASREDQWPFYAYISVTPTLTPEGEPVPSPVDEVYAQLQAQFPKQVGEWEVLEVATPRRSTIAWKRISIRSVQHFFTVQSIERKLSVAEQQLPARFDLCVYEGTDYTVMVAWRVPDGNAEQGEVSVKDIFDLDTFEPLTLGTLRGAGPPRE